MVGSETAFLCLPKLNRDITSWWWNGEFVMSWVCSRADRRLWEHCLLVGIMPVLTLKYRGLNIFPGLLFTYVFMVVVKSSCISMFSGWGNSSLLLGGVAGWHGDRGFCDLWYYAASEKWGTTQENVFILCLSRGQRGRRLSTKHDCQYKIPSSWLEAVSSVRAEYLSPSSMKPRFALIVLISVPCRCKPSVLVLLLGRLACSLRLEKKAVATCCPMPQVCFQK